LNVQTERLENHVARLTVEVPQERYAKAREASIKALSGKVNIPGFRKGKVPASMVVKYVGEAYILEEVMEHLGQDVYKEALEIAGVEPAAPGSMDDFKLEPAVTFVYTVPLAPEVTLNDSYRDFRAEYTEPETTDEDVETELRAFQREFAETVDSDEPVALGDRITADLHSFFVTPEAETNAEETDVHDREEEPYVHRHGAVLDLSEGEDEPLAPGFSAQIVGAKAGETRVFRITMPESGDNVNPDVAGKTIEFVVTVEKIERVTLPELDDALAAKVSERYGWETLGEVESETLGEKTERLTEEAAEAEAAAEPAPETVIAKADMTAEGGTSHITDTDEAIAKGEADESAVVEEIKEETLPVRRPLTLEELRARVYQMIDDRSKSQAREKYANAVLENVISNADVKFSEASLEAEIDDMIEDFKNRLQQNRVTLDLYLKSTGKTLDDIRTDYRGPAETRLRRSLAVREFANRERLNVSQQDLTDRLMSVFTDLGAESVQQLGLLNNEQFAANMINNLMSQKIEERAVAIGRGEAPDLNAAPEQPAIAASEPESPAAETSETETETEQ
jgi:trigger factor